MNKLTRLIIGFFLLLMAGSVPAEESALETVIKQLQAKVGGEVISAEEVVEKQIKYYRIKMLLSPGRVKVFRIKSD